MPDDFFSQWLSGLDFEYWSTGRAKIEPSEFFEKWANGEAILLDVRAPEEKEFVTFPFALEIPVNELPARLNEVPRDKLVVTFCSGGYRAIVAFAYLHAQGFENVRFMAGGYVNMFPELLPAKVRALRQRWAQR